MNEILNIAYSNLSPEQVEIEFQNLIGLIQSYLESGHIENASDVLIELEFNVNHTRSERKMNALKMMNDKFYKVGYAL